MNESTQWDQLVNSARERFKQCGIGDEFETDQPEAEKLLKDIDGHSHYFVLACLMDRQIDARKAWRIPYIVGLRNNRRWGFPAYEELELDMIKAIFAEEKLHRYHKMVPIFYDGIRRIRKEYGGVASNIWAGEPAAARIIRRFYEFNGVGQKIATMATNILYRTFKVPMKDVSMIDISVDSQVLKFFKARGLLRQDAKNEELIYLAREIHPAYPGILDLPAWEGGKQYRRQSRKRTSAEL